MLGLRIKSGPQPICLRHPLSEQSGNSKPIFPDDPNFVNKVEEACNPLSARVEGLLSQFSNLPNLLPHANPTVASRGEGCKYFLYEKNYANTKRCFSLQGT